MNTQYHYTKAQPIYCSSSFDWKGKNGACDGSKLIKVDEHHIGGHAKGIYVKSSKTGAVKYFEPIYDEDGYDGEFMVYGHEDISLTIWNY